MHEDSKAMTAFQTPDGNYQFKRMPFGLKNAVSEFSKIMFTVLGHLSNFVEIYLDDINIHSKNYEDHLKHIETVAACLKEANLKIKPTKCKWICTEISLLGHIVSGGTVRMDPKKIDAIQLRTPPKNVKQVQQYLGICNYYRRFIQDYAKMAKPMFNLLKTDKEFKWDDEAQISFDNLKKAPNFKTTRLGKTFPTIYRCLWLRARCSSFTALSKNQTRICMRLRFTIIERGGNALRNY